MRNLFVFILAVALLAQGCEFIPNGIKGNGKVTEKEIEVGDFKAVDVRKGFDLYLTKGESTAVRIEADENLIPHIQVRVEGNTLIITSRKNIWRSRSLKAYVTYTALEAINASGGSDVYSKSKIKAERFNLSISGGSDAEADIEANTLDADLSGGSDLELEYAGRELNLSASGGCDAELTLKKLKRSIINTSGGSDVSVIGECENLTLNASGGSDFNARGFKVAVADISASGAADVRINVTEEISVSASGASSVHYDGGAKIVRQDIGQVSTLRGN
ncbi:hypothetical protein L21SP5_02795 [Salinivirga cyanobacteriivorans]|uniref:Putative auto-transporter adhesin head GIN domain-containing protein n=1 Tax=Salinivirga cyanobacteriivorans TaxID=1307839 RepID=A0A0S2I2C9_9BACT|nr:head GIN domain-containing protein [Salinivirga cyanobacteriivorans]ALO16416.1 hypothetical protein L21SP5_02795 [Salinivirga cyanobacteriivorans]